MFLLREDDYGTKFLHEIAKNFSGDRFAPLEPSLARYGVLDPACSLDSFFKPLKTGTFPLEESDGDTFAVVSKILPLLEIGDLSNIYERSEIVRLQWWIDEGIGFDLCLQVDAWIKLYVSALFVYCERRAPFLNIGADYFYLIVNDEANACSERGGLFLNFIEWLHENILAGANYDDYAMLLAWLLLARLRYTVTKEQFDIVKRNVLSRKKTSLQASSSLAGREINVTRWLDLHKRIPLRYGATHEEFIAIILGVNRPP